MKTTEEKTEKLKPLPQLPFKSQVVELYGGKENEDMVIEAINEVLISEGKPNTKRKLNNRQFHKAIKLLGMPFGYKPFPGYIPEDHE